MAAFTLTTVCTIRFGATVLKRDDVSSARENAHDRKRAPRGTSAGNTECGGNSCPGFARLRLVGGGAGGGGACGPGGAGAGPVGFVEFGSTGEAAAAMARLQGALLLSSEGAIHLEYARHKLAHNGWILAHEVCTSTFNRVAGELILLDFLSKFDSKSLKILLPYFISMIVHQPFVLVDTRRLESARHQH